MSTHPATATRRCSAGWGVGAGLLASVVVFLPAVFVTRQWLDLPEISATPAHLRACPLVVPVSYWITEAVAVPVLLAPAAGAGGVDQHTTRCTGLYPHRWTNRRGSDGVDNRVRTGCLRAFVTHRGRRYRIDGTPRNEHQTLTSDLPVTAAPAAGFRRQDLCAG